MAWVLDPSLALAAAFPDESSELADRFLERLAPPQEAWVPALWWYEVANALTTGIRRGRISEADGTRVFQIFSQLSLQTDFGADADTAWRLVILARAQGLSAYDASYLELALRRGLGLASLDSRLRAAAKAAGVRII